MMDEEDMERRRSSSSSSSSSSSGGSSKSHDEDEDAVDLSMLSSSANGTSRNIEVLPFNVGFGSSRSRSIDKRG